MYTSVCLCVCVIPDKVKKICPFCVKLQTCTCTHTFIMYTMGQVLQECEVIVCVYVLCVCQCVPATNDLQLSTTSHNPHNRNREEIF